MTKAQMTALIIAIALLIAGAAMQNSKEEIYTEATVIVHTGTDTGTLWSIAAEYAPNYMDLRKYINIIKKDNGLTSNIIYPGQVLTIRVYEEK